MRCDSIVFNTRPRCGRVLNVTPMNFGTMGASCQLGLRNFRRIKGRMTGLIPHYEGVFLRLHGSLSTGRGLLTTILCSSKSLGRAKVCSVARRMSHMNAKSTFINKLVCNLLACPSSSRGTLSFTLTTSYLGGAFCKSFGLTAITRMRTLVGNSSSNEMRHWLQDE